MNKNGCPDDTKAPAEADLAAFALFGASFPGRDHVRRARNNQDAFAVVRSPAALCAVVCDGCSEGGASEVGARLGARWLAAHLGEALTGDELDSEGASRLAAGRMNGALAGFLEGVLGELSDEEGRADLVAELGLFTWVAAVVTPQRYLVAGVGDGVVAVNGAVRVLDAGPGNAPDYVGYRLVPASRLARLPDVEPRVLASGATAELASLVVATDGAGVLHRLAGEVLPDGQLVPSLLEVCLDDAVVGNPSLLEKRLRVLGERAHLLHDDTTVSVVARRTS